MRSINSFGMNRVRRSTLFIGICSAFALTSGTAYATPSLPTVTQEGSALRLNWSGNTGTFVAVDRAVNCSDGSTGSCVYSNLYWASPTNTLLDTDVSPGNNYQYKVHDSSDPGHLGYSAAHTVVETAPEPVVEPTPAVATGLGFTIDGLTVTLDNNAFLQVQPMESEFPGCQGTQTCDVLGPGIYRVIDFSPHPDPAIRHDDILITEATGLGFTIDGLTVTLDNNAFLQVQPMESEFPGCQGMQTCDVLGPGIYRVIDFSPDPDPAIRHDDILITNVSGQTRPLWQYYSA